MDDDTRPVYQTTPPPPYTLPVAGILCIAIVCYLILVAVFFMVKQILQQRGLCHEMCSGFQGQGVEGPGLECCDCCITLSDQCPCNSVVNAPSPCYKTKFSLFDILSCTGCCTGSGNAEICNYSSWRCDQYCHYLRCCGCIIRFNEPYILWNADADPFQDIDFSARPGQAVDKPPTPVKEEVPAATEPAPKKSTIENFLSKIRGAHYDLTGVNVKPGTTDDPIKRGLGVFKKFTASYGPSGVSEAPAPYPLGDMKGPEHPGMTQEMYMQGMQGLYDPRFGSGLGTGFRKGTVIPESLFGPSYRNSYTHRLQSGYPMYDESPVMYQPTPSHTSSRTSVSMTPTPFAVPTGPQPYGQVGYPYPYSGYPIASHGNTRFTAPPQYVGTSAYTRRMRDIDPVANPMKFTKPFFKLNEEDELNETVKSSAGLGQEGNVGLGGNLAQGGEEAKGGQDGGPGQG